jgi:hypothetical protein
MAKKETILIHRDEDLAAIDDELDAALGELESTNHRIGELLQTIEPGPESGSQESAAADTTAAETSQEAEPAAPTGDA